MSKPVIPERKMHRERLEAIRDWGHPKYSTGVHVTRTETVEMASRVLAAEAKVEEQAATISELEEENTSVESALEAATDVKNDKIREQAATIERLRIERDILLSVISPAVYETVKDRIVSISETPDTDLLNS